MRTYRLYRLVCCVLCSALLLTACGKTPEVVDPTPPKPPRREGPSVQFESRDTFLSHLSPGNMDMDSWQEMEPVIRNSLRFVSGRPQDEPAIDPRQGSPAAPLTWGDMRRTLEKLLELLPRLDKDPRLFDTHFAWVPVQGGMGYSGYYEPVVRASWTQKPGYEHPVYATPPDIKQVKRRKGKYHDRRAIDGNRVLEGKGLELVWAADPVDVFFLQIQGSGRLLFEDGSTMSINYDGQNGHKYKSSGRIMAAKGLLKEGHVFEQKTWFKNNPHRVNEILFENPSYVFFKLGNAGAIGAMGYPLRPWASIATDRKVVPLGSVVAYGVNIPDRDKGAAPLRAIGLAQDVGGAIKRNRVDIFCGNGDEAEYVACKLDKRGPAWILVAKNDTPGPAPREPFAPGLQVASSQKSLPE